MSTCGTVGSSASLLASGQGKQRTAKTSLECAVELLPHISIFSVLSTLISIKRQSLSLFSFYFVLLLLRLY